MQFGYSVYRTVLGYYANNENAYGTEEIQLICLLLAPKIKILKFYRSCTGSACTHLNLSFSIFIADMRKAMPRDKEKKSIIPLTRPVKPHELEFD